MAISALAHSGDFGDQVVNSGANIVPTLIDLDGIVPANTWAIFHGRARHSSGTYNEVRVYSNIGGTDFVWEFKELGTALSHQHLDNSRTFPFFVRDPSASLYYEWDIVPVGGNGFDLWVVVSIRGLTVL